MQKHTSLEVGIVSRIELKTNKNMHDSAKQWLITNL